MARGKADEKLYYKIGEACRILDIQPYVLRYWETEFQSLTPSKSRSGQRVYTDKELAIIRRIKELLYQEGYTIAGAKKKLESELEATGEPGELELGESAAPAAADPETGERLAALERGVEKALAQGREILELLDRGLDRA
ncbi:MAG TPA: MerR family transcriptional regulator [Thermoanaerobaculia bacterium]|nr:MerR family transcriptional regulator [Thermoanaerobaculia bacterium]